MYEVEQKFAVDDPEALCRKLAELGAELQEPVRQVDHYFSHPSRDFAQTDEALRIRTAGERAAVTYKGPKLDQTTKTRREIELPLPPGPSSARDFGQLLEALGFRGVLCVSKSRRTARLRWEGAWVEIALDEVDRLGTFVEIELAADDSSLDAARGHLESLCGRLGLTAGERRSYLEMILAQKSDGSSAESP